MKAALPNPIIDGACLKATVSTGFTATGPKGQAARMAIVDEHGNILAVGEDVAWAAWRVCVEVQENFWEGQGHLVVHTSPPCRGHSKKLAA
ncbi:hypothetical protein [Pseudomonas chlororaphis]|uniref:Uncharacterized protein n=1 Tax=Pseudomonas chlororaphis TaxID=587753 RepID=A0AAX3G551_9PSED|nr:hypothetical protein [Pseudomonas chlororaphis]AZC37078.1 hypothetical protein C4K37_2691 [Pseudomonas chlororaphis subsp. piscium]AZC43624.1 hypothetical protein C4K36_2699 [Pseudomonas chlororaphis subsp. piscium]WDG75487.1 hypothetical protein PUP65_14280 [Pseudomonas chlororaphis]WDH26877.1 hypothetical protein PUP81_20030 [Pseudomonas chlororaphis]WDH74007.1 hypothetical protein PUP78_14275 [Pseudomonas chlororaphis]